MTDTLELSLTLYPDPVLRKPSEPVAAFDDELRRIVDAMFARMRASRGVGLAAPQVGLKKRILVLNPDEDPANDLVLVNPTIVARGGPQTLFDEGCLSFPGIYVAIDRPRVARLRARGLDGEVFEAEGEALFARAMLHENDHLTGKLMIDFVGPLKKRMIKKKLEREARSGHVHGPNCSHDHEHDHVEP